MRDVGPVVAVDALFEVKGWSEGFDLGLHPVLLEVFAQQFLFLPCSVDAGLTVVEGDLTNHSVEHILDLASEQDLALGFVAGIGEQALEGQHFPEHRRGFGQRQRGRAVEIALPGGQHLMHAVAQLVGEGHDIPCLALIVHQHVGVRRGYAGVGEGTGVLAGDDRRVDPALVEEITGDLGHGRGKPGVGVEHPRLGIEPRDLGFIGLGQGRVAVPGFELLQPQPLGLHRVVPVRDSGEGLGDGVGQRLHHLVLNLIGDVAGRHRALVAPPAVVDLLLLDHRVVDPGQQALVVAEGLGDRRSGLGPGFAIGVGEQVEDFGVGQRFAVDVEAQRGHGLIEQLHPGIAADNGEVVGVALQLVRELVGLHQPGAGNEAGPRLHRILRQFLRHHVIADVVELQREEYQFGADQGRALVDPGLKLHGLAVRALGRAVEEGIGPQLAQTFVNALVPGDGLGQLLR